MNEKTSSYLSDGLFREGVIAAVSTGFFFILIGIIFVINQNLWPKIKDFGNDFTIARIANTSIQLPAPASPAAHVAVYSAVFQFALGIGILEILILAMRLANGSGIIRIAQSVGSVVFWFGAAYLLTNLADMKSTLSHSQQLTRWYQFWAAIIIMIGISIVVRSGILLAKKQLQNR
ncbi:MAG: hypothetical protein ABSE15_05455 [Candidatus Bathyarchaeia archaeon]|jgi:hypothetical protein